MAVNRVGSVVRRRAAATTAEPPPNFGMLFVKADNLPLTSSSSMPTSRPTVIRSRKIQVFLCFIALLVVCFVAKQRQQRQQQQPQQHVISFGGNVIQGMEVELLKEPAREKDDPTPRELTLDDLILGDYIASGAVNAACDVEFPDWWYTQQRNQHHNKSERKVLKLTTVIDEGSHEVDILRKLNDDETIAHRLNFVPILFWAKNVRNPFHKNGTQSLPESFPHQGTAHKLRKASRIVAHVVPYLDEDRYIEFSSLASVGHIRIFIRSLVEQLAHAYNSYGIVNYDLSSDNVWVDPTDFRAVVTDWNGGWADVGEPAWAGDVNFQIVPPEALLKKGVPPDGRRILIVSASAYDVWTIGIQVVMTMYHPCFWAKSRFFDTKADLLRASLQAIGGNMNIPVSNATDLVDLAALVGLDSQKTSASKFQPLLYQNNDGVQCKQLSFKAFQDEKKEGREGEAFDFIRSILKVSPLDRPKYEELLQHPFLKP